jgi:hypothetical protein
MDNNLLKNKNKISKSSEYFKQHNFLKCSNLLNSDICTLLYTHVLLNSQRLLFFENSNMVFTEENKERWGTFNDSQAPGSFSLYGDTIFDSLLLLVKNKLENLINIKLVPTYSYHRLYTSGAELKRHKDRTSCEISVTLCLGFDNSNLGENYKNWNWPMFVNKKDEEGGKGIPIHMEPGDIIIYRGCEIEHWREPFAGNNHAQVFLHYNEENGQFNNLYDGRPVLGLPASFRK